MKNLIAVVILFAVSFQLCAQEKGQIIRLAKLEIDSSQLQEYRAALRLEIETSVRVEPGVLLLNAVAEKDDPTHITIMEVYENKEAYLAHLETPHFETYKFTTKSMVISLELVDVVSVAMASKRE